ncbi:DNA helicase MCM9-like isoform X2 [Photinus pyralis]|nr:DNA helicase MCM9-like isoform X2 [Photinus pyralis]
MVLNAQDIILQQLANNTNLSFKHNIHARVFGLPACPELHRKIFPYSEDLGLFLQIRGTVIKTKDPKILEYHRLYRCTKCKYVETVTASYDQKFIIVPPKRCPNPEQCGGRNFVGVGGLVAENCKDYQEIKIQELSSNVNSTMPSTMWVTLEDDLVDTCQPGDDVTICAIVKRRFGPLIVGKRIEVELCLKANHVLVHNGHTFPTLITADVTNQFQSFWKTYENSPLVGRDLILQSFCPKLFGMYLVKLSVAVVLATGGSSQQDDVGSRKRSEAHLLLVGDPGTGKSHLLRYASRIISRSVLTTGVGTTSAGLTVAAVIEDGQWQLEAGALVLADGGICCIDEFNSMKPNDRASIHEAMEQQTISVAKAGILCKLRTRCSILSATNPKGGHLDDSQSLSLNLAIPSPLLSRFDIVLMLKDTYREEWDRAIAKHVLDEKFTDSPDSDTSLWSMEMLQQYFVMIKTINPVLTTMSDQILGAYYQAQRRQETRNKSRTTVRLLESLIRLSQGHARLMYHSEVQVMDAVFAIVLIECSMHGECAVLSLGPLNVLESYPGDPMGRYAEIVNVVLTQLGLNQILQHEMNFINTNYKTSNLNTQRDSCNARDDSPETSSTSNCEVDNVPENTDSVPKGSKRKTKERKSDSNGLNCIPSVIDSFNFNIDDCDKNWSEDPHFPVESQNTKIKNIQKKFKFTSKALPRLPKNPSTDAASSEAEEKIQICATTNKEVMNVEPIPKTVPNTDQNSAKEVAVTKSAVGLLQARFGFEPRSAPAENIPETSSKSNAGFCSMFESDNTEDFDFLNFDI